MSFVQVGLLEPRYHVQKMREAGARVHGMGGTMGEEEVGKIAQAQM